MGKAGGSTTLWIWAHGPWRRLPSGAQGTCSYKFFCITIGSCQSEEDGNVQSDKASHKNEPRLLRAGNAGTVPGDMASAESGVKRRTPHIGGRQARLAEWMGAGTCCSFCTTVPEAAVANHRHPSRPSRAAP